MRTYERSGVTVDQCTECRGIFLDRGELEKLFEAEANWNRQQAAPPAAAAPAARNPRRPRVADMSRRPRRRCTARRTTSRRTPSPPHAAPAAGARLPAAAGVRRPAYGYHGHYRHKRHKSFLNELFD